MKTSFDKIMDPEYIGDYMQEYRKTGFFKTGSLKKAEDYQKKLANSEIICISLSGSKFIEFLHKRSDPASQRIISKIFSPGGRDISKGDYLKINQHLEELSPELMPYINDFALIVIYAKYYCFGAKYKRNVLNDVINEDCALEIQNFFASLTQKDNDIDIKQIDVKYRRKAGQYPSHFRTIVGRKNQSAICISEMYKQSAWGE